MAAFDPVALIRNIHNDREQRPSRDYLRSAVGVLLGELDSTREVILALSADLAQERARADAAEQDLTEARAEVAHLTCRDGA